MSSTTWCYRICPSLTIRVQYKTVVALAEFAGKAVLSQSLASSFRPRKYYTIPKETVEAALEDVEQLSDFLLLEFQRILFAENVTQTFAV